MYAQDSIELLTTSGIQFKKHEDEGIETLYFAELLMTSGVVLCDGVKWLSFHRYSLCKLPPPKCPDVPTFTLRLLVQLEPNAGRRHRCFATHFMTM